VALAGLSLWEGEVVKLSYCPYSHNVITAIIEKKIHQNNILVENKKNYWYTRTPAKRNRNVYIEVLIGKNLYLL
jgi:hypothetical protein